MTKKQIEKVTYSGGRDIKEKLNTYDNSENLQNNAIVLNLSGDGFMKTATVKKSYLFLKYQDKISTVLYKAVTSHIFSLFLTIISAICFASQNQVISGCILLAVMIVEVLLIKDLSCLFLPFTLFTIMLINLYLATPEDFKQNLLPLAGFFLFAFIAHFFIFKIKMELGKQFWTLCFVSLAVLWGGGIVTTFSDYFKPVNIYFTLGLSVGMLAVYIACRNSMFIDEKYDALLVFSKSMLYVGLMGVLLIFPYVYTLITTGAEYSIQWQNNLSTYMFISMPFAFYYASKCKFGIVFFCLGIAEYLVCFFTFSRSGMLFGAILLLLCIIFSFIGNNRKSKWFNLIPIAIILGVGIFVILQPETLAKIKYIMEIDFENDARIGLMQTAIRNFANNPIFGAGLSFVGNDYVNKGFTVYLYHSAPFQIIGSFGLVGVVAFGWQFLQRTKIVFGKFKIFNIYIMLSFIGLEMMSLVNPGTMCPLPYGLIMVVLCTIAEIANEKNVDANEVLKYKFITEFNKWQNKTLTKKVVA